MKIVAALLTVAGLGFFVGVRYAPQAPPAPEENLNDVDAAFARISQEELREYHALRDQRAKYDKANQILAKVMKIFVADLGLRATTPQVCAIGSSETPGKIKQEILPNSPAPAPQAAPPSPAVAPATAPSAAAASTPAKKSASTSRNDPSSWRRGPVEPEKAKGAVHALYQAILWRAPDEQGGNEATQRMSEDGWESYLRNARTMIRSPEFLQEVEPNHTPEQIVHHMYGVYFGRCAFTKEMEAQLNRLRSEGAGGVIADVIRNSRRRHAEQIFKGGFSPTSCPR